MNHAQLPLTTRITPLLTQAITPPSDRARERHADIVQEIGASLSMLQRALSARRPDRARRTLGWIQNGYWRLDFRPPSGDMLVALAQLANEQLAGHVTLPPDLVVALRPIVDAMESEVDLLEEQI